VSVAVGAVLDAYDPIDTAYQLEVSSPGAERPLRDGADWRRHLGRRVNVRYRSGDGDTVVEGLLLSVSDASVEVEVQGGRGRRADLRTAPAAGGATGSRRGTGSVTIPVSDVVAGRLAVDI
jgi:ribosome maturation factor RimP